MHVHGIPHTRSSDSTLREEKVYTRRWFYLLYSSRSRVCRLTIGTATPWM